MDEIQQTGQEIVVTKRGKPVVRLLPATPKPIPDLSKSVLFEAENAWDTPLDLPWFSSLELGGA